MGWKPMLRVVRGLDNFILLLRDSGILRGVSSLRISEIFASIQGEGIWTGVPSVFVRVSGCNLRCVWCDTPYASWNPEGPVLSVDEVVSRVIELAGEPHAEAQRREEGIGHVVVTGGEPMLFEPVVELCARLRELGFVITIETAGTVFRELECDLMSISPKLANSDPPEGASGVAGLHAARRSDLGPLGALLVRYDSQLKFVVNPEEGLDGQLAEIDSILAAAVESPSGDSTSKQAAPHPPAPSPLPGARGGIRHPILLMPEGTDAEILRRREQLLVPVCMERGWRLSARRHIEWFGNTRGT